MAKMTGPFPLAGSLGNISFYINREGKCIARRKGGPRPNMFHTHPHFERNRENSAEFGGASTTAGKIRSMFSGYGKYCSEGSHFNRLMGLIHTVARFDPQSIRGQRNVFNGNIYLLEGFEFSKKLSLAEAVNTEFSHFIEPETGRVEIHLSSFVPVAAVKAPPGAKYFQIIAKAGTVYEEADNPGLAMMKATPLMLLHGKETGSITLELDAGLRKIGGEAMILTGAGVIFYEEEMGVPIPMRSGAFALLGVERTTPYEEAIVVDKKAGEVTDRTAAIAQENEARKTARQTAEARQAVFIEEHGFKMLKELNAIIEDEQLLQEITAKRKKLDRHLWLRKLERYRRG
jgi:hypothetical protein